MKYNELKKQKYHDKQISYQNKHLINELNNYLSFYILKDRIKMQDFFKSIRKNILSGQLLSPKQFETLIPYLIQEPEMRHLGENKPQLIRSKVIDRYRPLIRNSQHAFERANLDQFLPPEYLEQTSYPIQTVR